MAGRGPRLAVGARLGANHCVDVAAGLENVGETKFDVVIEAVGKPETWEAARALARKVAR